MDSFGELLWRARTARGWAQVVLAPRAGLALDYVRELERGRRHPSRSTVLALVRALDLRAGPRDQLLIAAGYAPDWLQVAASDPELLYRLWVEARDGTHGWRVRAVAG